MKNTPLAGLAVAGTILFTVASCRHESAIVREPPGEPPRPPIATLADFDRMAAAQAAPFDGLTPDAIADIRAGLVFDDLGVERYDYGAIQKHLTMAQYDALLDLFEAPDDPNAPPCPVRGYDPFVKSTAGIIDRAPIHGLADFDRILMSGTTPLSKLSPVAVRRLRDSLTITDFGVGGLSYFEAQNELSGEDFEALMRLFFPDTEPAPASKPAAHLDDPGLQLPPYALPDMYCEAQGTCGPKQRKVCNLNSC